MAHPDQKYGNTFWSQNGEDIIILNLFDQIGMDRPSYLDLGAHSPDVISNTYMLNQRGSIGVNVEANPNLIEAFNIQRPRDKNVNVAVVAEATDVAYLYMYDDWSGRNTCSEEEAISFQETSSFRVTNKIQVPAMTINQIVDRYCGEVFPSFISCDLEGLDFEVLQKADFTRSRPIIICVECREYQSTSMQIMMRDQGYSYYCRMGENIIFIYRGINSLLRGC